ncbi:hypothetical protein QY95_04041 [Bacillus thermotolerans]|uniref:Uncharacterized protein n=1 Tax=Bacillus thermotolerans TaxID=1221996 RepID=A0A0F5HMA5_BACTR|nr:hypothetical protein QY95_04041 [Bacillus thermotolerans]
MLYRAVFERKKGIDNEINAFFVVLYSAGLKPYPGSYLTVKEIRSSSSSHISGIL